MKIIFSKELRDINHFPHTLEICVGDATKCSADESVDILAISSFKDCYAPTPGTMIESLWKQGIDVDQFAADKEVDERDRWHCWISHLLPQHVPFRRILCFEQGCAIDPASVVGNVFRMVTEFSLSKTCQNFNTLRIPLLSTGDQRTSKSIMLEAIIRQAYNHLKGSLPVSKVQIVLHEKSHDIYQLVFEAGIFFEKIKNEWGAMKNHNDPQYDFFVSYRRIDYSYAQTMINTMHQRAPGIRMFIDENSIQAGSYWKPSIISGLHASRKAICLITDSYVDSQECIDEFHAALCCALHRDHFLLPLINLKNRKIETLPGTFRSLQMIDAACPPRKIDDIISDILTK